MRKENYTEETWQKFLEKSREAYRKKKEYYNEKNKQWRLEHPGYKKEYNETHKKENINYSSKCKSKSRNNGKTAFCTKNYELIENYELAKKDNFDTKKWHLHHRLENYWSSSSLKRKKLYYNLNPEALIWLPYEEHMKDRNNKNSKWHQRSLENE